MTATVAIAVAGVVAALTLADAVTARIVRHRVARLIAAAWRTTSPPEVRVTGPFLVQLVSGVYRKVRLTVPGFTAAGMDLTDLVASLSSVRAPISRLLAGDGVVVTELSASFAIPLAALNKRLPPGVALRWRRGELQIYSPLIAMPVAGTVAIDTDRRHISVTPRVAGVPSLVGVRVDLPTLPQEVTITSITVAQAALTVSVAGHNVRLAGAKQSGAVIEQQAQVR